MLKESWKRALIAVCSLVIGWCILENYPLLNIGHNTAYTAFQNELLIYTKAIFWIIAFKFIMVKD